MFEKMRKNGAPDARCLAVLKTAAHEPASANAQFQPDDQFARKCENVQCSCTRDGQLHYRHSVNLIFRLPRRSTACNVPSD